MAPAGTQSLRGTQASRPGQRDAFTSSGCAGCCILEVNTYLEDTYDVEYSIPSCRRLLKEAGLSYQKPRRSAAEADEDDQEEFHDELKKSGGRWTPP
ncbi:winged helix-turn-helix domain-containing protein [Halobacterium salinarum]|uniref:helix-turn-helix domain-containing protein n=1 Tax=Halobacterium salinarum TaxID=2242 RepID=UPI00308443EA